MIDSTRVGNFAMEAIDAIGEAYLEADGVVTTGDLMLVAEIRVEQSDGSVVSHTETYSSDPRPHIQFGQVRAAQLATESRR